jgi:endo-1,4-beta-mannosidase
MTPSEKEAFLAFVDAVSDGLYWCLFDDDAEAEEMEELAGDCMELGFQIVEAWDVEITDIVSPTEFSVKVKLPENVFAVLDEKFGKD